MAIKLSELKNHVQHALGGNVSTQLSEAGIVNEAGRYMFMAPWKFRERPPITIQFVANQDYAELPDDFGELIAANMTDGLVKSFTFTTYQDLVQRRSTSTGATNHYWVAITHPAPEGDAVGVPQARLELYPQPTADDQLTVAYRAKWTTLATDDSVARIPDYAESALISVVRAFALGYEEEAMEQRLAEIETGPIWIRLKEKDGLIQPDYGPLRNSALSMSRSGYQLPWDSTADPS